MYLPKYFLKLCVLDRFFYVFFSVFADYLVHVFKLACLLLMLYTWILLGLSKINDAQEQFYKFFALFLEIQWYLSTLKWCLVYNFVLCLWMRT